MFWKNEWRPLLYITGLFLLLFFLPLGWKRFDASLMEALHLAKWYAREHVILCLLPAFFIAGAIAVFINQSSVMKYLGPQANKFMAYGVSSVSGSILAVCSCTVLPLFSGIHRMGAGLGPATTFLYSGPAINILAIILTANVLGSELGIARALGAIIFSIVIGLIMHFIYRKEEDAKAKSQMQLPQSPAKHPLWQNALFFLLMVLILVFVNWAKPDVASGFWFFLYSQRWLFTIIFTSFLGIILFLWFNLAWWKILLIAIATALAGLVASQEPLMPFSIAIVGLSIAAITSEGEVSQWFNETWSFAKQILPLLLLGVLAAGFLLGRPGHEGVIPSQWVNNAVGGNGLGANLFASMAGAFMYFATLTEIPILQGLIGAGMGKGPALALLLAGPALSLPSMLVIRSILGNRKTAVYVSLVILMSALSGKIYGEFF